MAIATVSASSRVLNPPLASRIMSAEEAAALIHSGDQIGMSGFTGSGYPKAVPLALARRISDANLRGQKFQVSIFTGASTGPELDGALAMAGGIHLRLPYQSDPETRKRINAGEMEYMDIHLSHVAQFVEYGFLGKLDMALIEVTAVLEDGRLVPSSSLGNNKTWIEQAEHVIIEVNSWQPEALEGMHDIYYGLQPPPNRDRFHSRTPASALAARISRCRRIKSLRWCSPTHPIATARSRRRTRHRAASQDTFWNFWPGK
jgi:succinyl-CoA:acetate CoA-transferase